MLELAIYALSLDPKKKREKREQMEAAYGKNWNISTKGISKNRPTIFYCSGIFGALLHNVDDKGKLNLPSLTSAPY